MEIRFKLKESNSKDVVIMKMLEEEYNHNDFVKNILYKLASGQYKLIKSDLTNNDIFGQVGLSTECSGNIVENQKFIENKEISSDLEENTEVEEEMDIVVDNDIMDFF